MSIDLSQFHQTFFDESREGIDVMESQLLNLDVGNADAETINTVFRAAHSIKGGGATFGFETIASFTHHLEAILDEMRNGSRAVDQNLVDVLLEAIDCLRALMDAAQHGGEADDAGREAVEAKLRTLLESAPAASEAAPAPEAEQVDQSSAVPVPTGVDTVGDWEILFQPYADMLKSGNDPVRMFKELDALGELDIRCDTSRLPQFRSMDPEASYLAWDLTLRGTEDRADIDEAFAWVEDECDLEITHTGGEGNANSEPVKNQEASAPDANKVVQAQASAPKPEKNAPRDSEALRGGSESGSIRVDINKIDDLINIVGEIVITQSMLGQFERGAEVPRLDQLYTGLSELERNTRELQESVMRIRMLPVSFVFNRFPRMVHDISRRLDKKVELELTGEQTELDKTILEKVGDPMVHLVRNAIDHGIENPEDRVRAGKPEAGTVHLHAYHEGGNIIIEISDDGAGLDRDVILNKARSRGLIGKNDTPTNEQIFDCIFEAGFSTKEEATDLSGRGVGMDVVRRNINSLGGAVATESVRGQGTTFKITLPLTLAIMEGQSAAVGEERYIIPLLSIIESLQVTTGSINAVAGRGDVFKFRDEHIPIIRLADIFGCRSHAKGWTDGIMVVTEGHGRRVGLFVDRLLGQQQAVIKSLEDNYRKVDGISGATVMGDGHVALILDVPGLIRIAHRGRAA